MGQQYLVGVKSLLLVTFDQKCITLWKQGHSGTENVGKLDKTDNLIDKLNVLDWKESNDVPSLVQVKNSVELNILDKLTVSLHEYLCLCV